MIMKLLILLLVMIMIIDYDYYGMIIDRESLMMMRDPVKILLGNLSISNLLCAVFVQVCISNNGVGAIRNVLNFASFDFCALHLLTFVLCIFIRCIFCVLSFLFVAWFELCKFLAGEKNGFLVLY